MSWKTQGLYLHRTRKPHAVLGLGLRWLVPAAVVLAWWMWLMGHPWPLAALLLLFSGRHNGYVGQTSSRYFRDQQHTVGDFARGKIGAAWSDLDIRIYPLPCLFPRSKWWREFQEKIWIFMLLPVYNTEWNTKNPRRIKKARYVAQRVAREGKRWGWLLPKLARAGLALLVLAGASWQVFM